jgi:hypothetical protein
MKHAFLYLSVIAMVLSFPTPSPAQQSTCKLQAVEKKITAQGMTAFMQKCENEAEAACDRTANVRKLEDPARSLFMRACIRALVGL